MKATKKLMAMLGGALLTTGLLAAPSVEITAVQQQYPWTNTVDITYEVRGVTNMEYFVRFTPTTSDDKEILDVNGEPSIQVALTNNGTYVAQWYPQTNLQYTACKMTPAIFRGGSGGGNDYMVVDLLTGTVTYEPMATQEASNQKYNTDEYKTKKMVFRRIEAGSYRVQTDSATAVMEKPFYIGVFEVTVAQYNLIVNAASSSDKAAIGNITYGAIRGGALPRARVSVSGSGIVAKLNKLTGRYFDLPTEAMWEVACRANSDPALKWPFGDSESALKDYAWYSASGYPLREVGRLLPNQWGLYDMLGNVWEWILDSTTSSSMGLTQTPANTGGTKRGFRGGSVAEVAGSSTPSYRGYSCLYTANQTARNVGLRLALIAE